MSATKWNGTRWGPGSAAQGTISAVNRLVLLVAIPLFLVLAVLAFLAFRFASGERDAQALVRHTYQVMEAERRLQDDVQTAETGMRGYLLSRDPVFESAYRSYLVRIPQDLKRLRELTPDNASQQARANRLQKLLEARTHGFEAALRGGATPVVRSPAALRGLMRGRQQMLAIRNEVTQGLAEEQKLLDTRERKRRESENLEVGFAVGATVLTLGILLLAAALLVRNNVSLAAAETALANEAAILRATLETVREGIAYFNEDGVLRAANSRFAMLLELPEPLINLEKKATLAEFDTLDRPPLSAIFQKPAATQKGVDATHVTWADRDLDIYKAPVSTGGFIIGVVDITERLKSEAVERQSQKLEAIGHLTGGVAHDFNNLLQVISVNLDLAAACNAVKTDRHLAQRIENARHAVDRGARLTRQLLAFARRQALEPKSLDLGRVIRDMGDLLRRTLGETIAVETVIARDLWNTFVDPSQVENTVLNLAINARDAMPDGGKLTLEVANAYLDDESTEIQSEVIPGQYVMLAVSDTGTGMTPNVLNRVFEPFFTTKPEGKGTGLGLAQAFGFVKQSGGHIKIFSEIGHGTTVKLFLPRTQRDVDMVRDDAQIPVIGGHEHILVVEDDADVRSSVVDMLRDLGYQVSHAENAQSALDLLGTLSPDLIFTDVVMPGAVSTRDFTRRAQELHPGVPILYTSGYAQNAIAHNGKLDDGALLLSKPYLKDELARKLRSIFAASTGSVVRSPSTYRNPSMGEHPGKVLVVEDIALIRLTTMDMVEQLGFEALGAADAREALSMLRQDNGIEILLTDLGLPGMNGRQLVEEALGIKPNLKVIIASGYSADTDSHQSHPAHVTYLAKPFDSSQLREILKS